MDTLWPEHISLRAERMLVAVGLLFILCAGTYKLSDSPGIWYDEGFYTQAAMNLAEGHGQVLQVAPEQFVSSESVTVGYPLIAPVALSYKLFGVGVVQGRAVMVLFLVLFAAAAYLLVRLLFDPASALLSLALIASYAVFYGNGKNVLGEVPGLFYLMLALLALVWLERSEWKDTRAYAAAGFAAGLCVATKSLFILLGPAGILGVLIAARMRMLSWKGVVLTVLAFIAPVLVWFHMQFGSGDSLATTLSFYANPYEYPAGGIVHLVLGNASRFIKEISPLYTLLFAGMWAVAIFLRLKQRVRLTAAEWTAALFALSVLLFFLRTPGWYRYFFPATMVALLFVPYSLRYVYTWAETRVGFLARARFVPICFLAVVVIVQVYQLGWDSWVASYYGSKRTEDTQTLLTALPVGKSVFLYNVPELAILLPTRNYYQYLMPHPDQLIGADELTVLKNGGTDFVVLMSSASTADSETFAHYRVKGTVNRYTVLESI